MSLGRRAIPRPGRRQTLEDVWEWYLFHRAIVAEEFDRAAAVTAGPEPPPNRYAGLTREELRAVFEAHRVELDQAAMLLMLASTEAALRVDFLDRVEGKWKDPVARRFRQTRKERGDRIRLEEDILDVWRDKVTDPGVGRAVSDFKGALSLRHWLAHGRYFVPKLGRASGYLPADVHEICGRLLNAAGLLRSQP